MNMNSKQVVKGSKGWFCNFERGGLRKTILKTGVQKSFVLLGVRLPAYEIPLWRFSYMARLKQTTEGQLQDGGTHKSRSSLADG